MPVVVTVTRPGVTVTAVPTSSGAESTSAGAIAGIVIGTLVGGVLLITLVLYLLNRYSRHKFTRVVNPAHDRVPTVEGAPDLQHLPSTSARRSKFFARHSQKPSISSEPLVFPLSGTPLPFKSQVPSLGTFRSDSVSLGIGDDQHSSYDFGQISQVVASEPISYSTSPAILGISSVHKPERTSPPSDLGDSPSHSRQTSGDDTPSPTATPKSQPKLFLRRMLQSRARASDGLSPTYHPSSDFSTSRSTTLDLPSFHVDEQGLLSEVELAALGEAEIPQGEVNKKMPEEDNDWGEAGSTESVYSQSSAPTDHATLFSDPVSRQNSFSSVPRRSFSRKLFRTATIPAELSPVVEVADSSGEFEGQSHSRRLSATGHSSLDRQISHATSSYPMSSVIDQPGTMPLLTSANFGKDSTTSGTPPGSIVSTSGWRSRSDSSGRASRYPSLAPSSIGQSSRSGPRSDTGTDWYHPPPGLAGLTSLQIGQLQNPHSPVEGQPEQPAVPHTPGPADPVSTKRAHLRGGTASSIPEVERRTVMQGGIAHIDVAL